ncbi:MAG: high frequency lysogenization protein HflD [Pseudomonadota bacterium]
MSTAYSDRILALAGLFQAARLAQQLAREGRADPPALAASVQSLLIIDAPTTESVYGGAQGVRIGLELLRDKLAGAGSNTDANDVEIARYVIGMIHLEGQLRRNPDMQDAIRRGVEAAREQMKFFEAAENGEMLHPRLAEKLAELYTQTLSTLTPRIMVNGEHGHLSNPAIAAKVRAALFAGIRSAFLWQQLGGSRWQLLFSRKKIADEAAGILENLGADREN